MSGFAEPTPDMKCLDCGTKGIISGSDFCTLDFGHEPDATSMVFACRHCGMLIPVSRDKVSVSPDPLFQIIGILGTSGGMLQLLDMDIRERPARRHVREPDAMPDPHAEECKSADPEVANLESPMATNILDRLAHMPSRLEYLISPGIFREYVFREPVDKVFTMGLIPLVPPELRDKVLLIATPVKNSDGRCASIRISASTSSPDILPEEDLNAICHFYVAQDISIYAPWLRQFIKGIQQAMDGNFEAAVLDYARAGEMFINSYLRQARKQTGTLNGKLSEKALRKTRISDRVRELLPLVTVDTSAYGDAQQAWWINVKTVRDERIAHMSDDDISSDEAQEAHDSAYWFIRAIQSQCIFANGRDWDFWANKTNIDSDTAEKP